MKVITTLFVGAFRAFYKDKRVIIAQRNAPLTLWQVPWSVAFSWMKVILTVLEGKTSRSWEGSDNFKSVVWLLFTSFELNVRVRFMEIHSAVRS